MFELNLQFFGIILIALLPVLGWLWFFQRKQPEKKTYVALTFLAGMLSVLPIKLYEAYWDVAIFNLENINMFQSIADLVQMQSLPKLLSFLIVDIVVATGLFLFVALLMFFLEVLSGDNTIKTFRAKFMRILDEPMFFISVGVILGLYTYFSSLSLHDKVYFFIIVGMLEEFIKHLVLRFSDELKIQSVDDALEFGIVVALGFAFVENILYFRGNIELMGSDIYLLILLRSTISVAAHVIFSAIFAYFYGVARFTDITYQKCVQSSRHVMINKLHQILHLRVTTLFYQEQMFIGMFCAMGLHAIFNSLLEFQRIDLVVPFIFAWMFIVIHLFHRSKSAIMGGTIVNNS